MYNHRMKKVAIGKDLSTRRAPESKKYANVKATINSGKTVTKSAESWEEMNVNVRFRKNEYFRRIRADTLLRLLEADDDDENSPQVLLLDLRSSDEYDSCHVRGAVNYPIAMLSRAMNPFIPEILEFCNREPEKIIVIYDMKERQSVTAGNLFFEKGIDNVFMLSKGMNVLIQDRFSHLLVGDIPRPLPQSAASSLASSRAVSAINTPTRLSTPLRQYDTKVKIKLLSSSLKKSKPSGWH